MQPLLTMEVRWFYKEGLPKPDFDLQRFRNGDLSIGKEKGKTRADFYLYLPGVDSLGMKFRGEEDQSEEVTHRKEMKLEVKSRQREDGIIAFPNGVTGRLEYWSKLEFTTESTNLQIFDVLQAEDKAWVVVIMERHLRKYDVADGKEVHSVLAETKCTNGCQMELTKLTARQQIWWTIGLEAFGETEEATVNNLRLSANVFFNQTGWEGFEEKDSYAYPRWLNVVMARSSEG